MNFSSLSNRSLLGQLLRLPLKALPPSLKMPILQGPMKGLRWVTGASDHGCWLGSYEFRKRAALESSLSEGGVFFDVGANVGFYTLLGAVKVGAGRVYAFEPLPDNLRYLRTHVDTNGLSNVEIIEAAVAAASGTARFEEAASRAMGRLSDEGGIEVDVVTLDELVASGRVEAPDVIKIDVEGAELDVLKGAREILATRRPTVFLATHGAEVHAACCGYLQELGYDLRAVEGGSIADTDELVAVHGGVA